MICISQEEFNFIQSQRTNKTNTNQTPIPTQSIFGISKDYINKTAIDYAREKDHSDIVELLSKGVKQKQ